MSSFAKYLQSLIDNRKLKQNQIALYGDVSESTVSYWLSGRSLPSPESLKKIATVLRVSYEELMQKAGYLDEEEPEENHRAYNHDKKFRDLSDLNDEAVEAVDKLIELLRKNSASEK